MFLVPTIDEIQNALQIRHVDTLCVVGIMLANYDTDFVKNAIRQYYSSWDIATGQNFDIYWPGYYPNNEEGQLVNFNSAVSAKDMEKYEQKMLKKRGAKNSLCSTYKNTESIGFDVGKYTEAKKYVRKQLDLKKNQPIDCFTLIIVQFAGGLIQFNKKETLIINLRSVCKADRDAITTLGELMSEINDICTTKGVKFSDIKKEIRGRMPAEKKDWSTPVSILLSVIQLLKDFVSG